MHAARSRGASAASGAAREAAAGAAGPGGGSRRPRQPDVWPSRADRRAASSSSSTARPAWVAGRCPAPPPGTLFPARRPLRGRRGARTASRFRFRLRVRLRRQVGFSGAGGDGQWPPQCLQHRFRCWGAAAPLCGTRPCKPRRGRESQGRPPPWREPSTSPRGPKRGRMTTDENWGETGLRRRRAVVRSGKQER